jgi:cell division protein FtsI (penicillin-binding protein 3)
MWRVEHAFEHAKAQRLQQDTTYRIFFVLMLFVTGFATLAAGAVTKALLSDPSPGRSAATPAVARADLVDRNGRLLAVDLTNYGAYLDPREVWDAAEARRNLLAALPNLPPARLDKALSSGRRVYLIGGLTPQERDRAHDIGLPGLSFEPEDHRVYPVGATAAHLIGFSDTGGEGIAGAERSLDKQIRQSGADGQPVALSIDIRVQAILDEELAHAAAEFQTRDAVGLVADAHTGEILAMASNPTFDPNQAGRSDPKALINHAAATVYEPGSVFKMFTLSMGMDSGVVNRASTFDVSHPLVIGHQTIHDFDKGDTSLSLEQVFTHSSNIGAATIALRAGGSVVDRYFRGFGLYGAAPVGMAESARPLLPRRDSRGALTDNALASAAFGQGISVSPLSVATAMTAVVNGGQYTPLTIRKLNPGERPQARRVVSPAVSQTMLQFLRQNVLSGSGRQADVPGYSVGGKTGTAQKAENGHYLANARVSTFAGVFPTEGPLDAPRYIVLVLLDEPHPTAHTGGFATAGYTAAPTVGRVIGRIAPFLGVARAPVLPQAAEGAAPAPIAAGTDE